MDFNRYIATGEFAALADWFRSEGEVVHYAAGDRFARQGCRNRHPAEWSDGALSAMCTSPVRASVTWWGMPLPESSWAITSRCAAMQEAVAGEHRSDVRLHGVACGRRSARSSIGADPACERLARRLAERLRLRTLRTDVAALCLVRRRRRYETLLRRCPELLNIVALKELASYLRVRPETLSRHSRPRAVRN